MPVVENDTEGVGVQVLENYGQPNSIYFKYHGFYMEGNTHNCVDIEVLDGLNQIRALPGSMWPCGVCMACSMWRVHGL